MQHLLRGRVDDDDSCPVLRAHVDALAVRRGVRVVRARGGGKLLDQPERIQLDDGARRAIVEQGRSLLAAGIIGTQGEFQKGDVVALCDHEGHIIARGLSNYSSGDVERIKGLKSAKISQVLGQRPYEEVIHRDNLALVKK